MYQIEPAGETGRGGQAMSAAYVAPFVVYLVGTAFIARFGDAFYPWLYIAVVLFDLAILAILLRGKGILKPHLRVLPGILVGIAGIAAWIGLCELQLEQRIGEFLPSWLQPERRVGYNPFEHLEGDLVWAFVAIRLLGLAVLVPLAEELFWRGFLLRWLIDPDWKEVPIGEFTLSSCLIVTALFTLAHPEWLAAAVYCLLINGLLYYRRDLWQCIVAHAVSNLLLGLYVLSTDAWWLW